MQPHPEYSVIEYFLEPSPQYPKLTQPESHVEHTDSNTTNMSKVGTVCGVTPLTTHKVFLVETPIWVIIPTLIPQSVDDLP